MFIIALATLVAWIALALRGSFWRLPLLDATASPDAPSTVAVIPARDEALSIASTLQSLFAQDYSGNFRVVLVDDHSTDGTADIARQCAEQCGAADKLTIISGQPLPAGWTGKLWAVHQGLAEARSSEPDYFLLTDADITHAPDNLRRCMAMAHREKADLVSLMVKLHCASPPEQALIPAFVYFFFMLYPPRWIADAGNATAAAAGGCMLIKRQMLEKISGVEAVRNAIIDDCTLAKTIKQSGGAVRLYTGADTVSSRAYTGAEEIWSMIARSAFAQLRYSWLLLAVAMAGLFVTFIAPPLLALFGHGLGRLIGICAWGGMFLTFRPTLALYNRSPLWGFALPLIALFYAAAAISSALQHAQGKGGRWKGRVHGEAA